MPHLILDEERKSFTFDSAKYRDAVVMPWYRNQDQPQVLFIFKSRSECYAKKYVQSIGL